MRLVESQQCHDGAGRTVFIHCDSKKISFQPPPERLQSINQSLFVNVISQVNKTKKCGNLQEQAIVQQSWPP